MEAYWRWLMYRTKLLPRQRTKCIEYFITPKNMFTAPWKEIQDLTFLSAPARAELERIRTEEELSREERELREKGIRFYSIDNPKYPEKLRTIMDPPYGLFVRGKLPPGEKRKEGPSSAAIIGARWASPGGLCIAREAARALSRAGVSILSGMAAGIDGAAQEAALEEKGKSYAVLGCGPDLCYPRCNRVLYERLVQEGGLISEYPPGTPPAAFHFPLRNRIISGLSDVVLVVEAREKSGSLITADYALEQGRDIYAVPGRIDEPLSQGCNQLISQGAGIYCSLTSFLKELHVSASNSENLRKKKLTLAKSEDMVYSCVDFKGQSLESIRQRSGLVREEVLRALVSLELMNLIEEKGRFYFRK